MQCASNRYVEIIINKIIVFIILKSEMIAIEEEKEDIKCYIIFIVK